MIRRSALEREELKYAHLARRETDAVRRRREWFEAYVAGIEPEVAPAPTGPCVELAPRYRGAGRPGRRANTA